MGWLLAVAGAGCDDGGHDASALPTLRGCITDRHCAGDETCVFRLCSPPCAADGSCSGGARCVETGRGRACVRASDNACVDSSDCPLSSDCIAGRCDGSCDADGGSWCAPLEETDGGASGAGGTGAAGRGGSGGSAGASSCPEGTLQCRDNVVTRCDARGRPQPERTCRFVCRAGACAGSCRPGELRCSGSRRERCSDGGAWVTLESCAGACTPSACIDVCTEGARSCEGDRVRLCRGGRQQVVQRCEYVCDEGMCTGTCRPGARQCRNNAVVTCREDGSWGTPQECSTSCIDGACTGECAPGEQRCGSNTSFQVCNARGQWSRDFECDGQACADGECRGECTPGESRCASATELAMCDAEGRWSSGMTCPGQACQDGACSGVCVPETRRCLPTDPFQPQVCSAQGQWQDALRCAAGETCVEGECSGECAPGARRCDPGDPARYQTCGDASEWSDARPCGDAMRCTGDGVCESIQTCSPGQAPEWFGTEQGADRGLYDPRWGGPLDGFSSDADTTAAGYALVFDRAGDELAITLRVFADDAATGEDYVFVAVASEDATVARAARVSLAVGGMGMAPDPRPLTEVEAFRYASGTWSPSEAPWVQGAAAWIDTPEVAWAASLRLDLAAAGLSSEGGIRIALGLRRTAEAQTETWTSPARLPIADPTATEPGAWPVVDLTEFGCTARIVLP